MDLHPPPDVWQRMSKAAKKIAPAPIDTRTVREKLDAGCYRNDLPYPTRGKDPSAKERATFAAARSAYDEVTSRLEHQFVLDLLAEHGVRDNPKANLCYQKAWDHGHAHGLSEVACIFEDLVELIK